MAKSNIEKLLAEKSMVNLDIGCGANKQPGFIGMDIRSLPSVDIIWDLNRHPWPLPDESIDQAMASHLVEHIPPVAIIDGETHFMFIEFMDEVWRILKPGGRFLFSFPHGSSSYFLQDPTHCNPINQATISYFDPFHHRGSLWYIYEPKPWRVENEMWDIPGNANVILVKRGLDEIAQVAKITALGEVAA